jgi:hypothetical protein
LAHNRATYALIGLLSTKRSKKNSHADLFQHPTGRVCAVQGLHAGCSKWYFRLGLFTNKTRGLWYGGVLSMRVIFICKSFIWVVGDNTNHWLQLQITSKLDK